MPLGLYISVPFCRTKCSYCNFASDVFSKGAFENYVARVIEDIGNARTAATELGGVFEESADSVYLGGGTPSILESSQLMRIFEAVRGEFALTADAEITVECAPGTLSPGLIETLLLCGVNRVSLGVQSFVDQEAQSVGRLHKRSTVLEEIARLRATGIVNINIDLIAGLPHQTAASWEFSLAEAVAAGAPHASVYMLEVDEDSRLGRELIAGGTRYHAHFVPDEGATADFYQQACDTLNAAGVEQYEISNFARVGSESRHNLKYWTRQPYLGFGVDAHSMLSAVGRPADSSGPDPGTSAAKAESCQGRHTAALKRCATQNQGSIPAVQQTADGGSFQAFRFSTPDSLDAYMNRAARTVTPVSEQAALEESFFLGLRLNCGVDLERIRAEFGAESVASCEAAIDECADDGLLEKHGTTVRLTARGRLLSNEVFARFLAEEGKVGTGHVNPR
ncbi:MAG: radical SAM family heme chaperone HemW [Acidobacteriia bacterium]|nr:radical SAM family heme chaperone HemW [Terriglobia bacterium]